MNTFTLIPMLTSILSVLLFISVLIAIIKRVASLAKQAKKALEKIAVSSQIYSAQKGKAVQRNVNEPKNSKTIVDAYINSPSAARLQKLSEKTPEQVYAILKDTLPPQKRLELQRILSNRNWKRDFFLFIDREDVDPFFKIDAESSASFEENSSEYILPDDELFTDFPSYSMNGEENGESPMEVAVQQKREENTTLKTAKRMEIKTIQKRKKLTPKKKMVIQAIIAKEILDRPRYE